MALHKVMAWEKRFNQRYYFRARRQGGKITKQYFGRGAQAIAAAEEDAARRAERAAVRQAEQERRQAALAVADQVAALGAEVDSLLEAALLTAGYWRPQRKAWRKKRVKAKA